MSTAPTAAAARPLASPLVAPSPPAVRPAGAADVDLLADVLARAFWDDPVQVWMIPGPRSRYARLRAFFRVELRTYLRGNRVVTTSDLGAAALWARPGAWRTSPAAMLRGAPGLLYAYRRQMLTGLGLLTAMEKAHPREDHWYLGVLGSDPNRRGTGAAAAVLRAVLDELDRDGVPAYLESSKETNIGYYERHGFRVTGEIAVAGAPSVWGMWRDPADPAGPS